MLKIVNIRSVFDTIYEGASYTIIETEALVDDCHVPEVLQFGSESLGKALCPDGDPKDRTAHELDREIYAYVPDDLHTKDDDAIKAWIEKEID